MTDGREERRVRRGSRLGWVASLVVIGAAAVAARYAGGTESASAAASPASNATAAAGAGSRQMVMLSSADAHRIGVTYAAVTRDPVMRQIRVVGQVSYDEKTVATITARVDGWIDSLVVNYTGQTVRRGDPLLTMYAPMAVAAEEDLLLAHRLRDSVAHGTPEAQQEAESLVEAARRRLAHWDVPDADVAAIEHSGVVRKSLTLRAAANGVVVQKNVVAGQAIRAGDPLYQLADLHTVWIEGEVFERDLPGVHVGQQVDASFEALPGAARSGRIAFINPTIDPDTRTARVRVELANADLALKPGMYATLTTTADQAPGSVSVPRNAVLSTGERNIVFVKRNDGMLEPREVVVGMAGDDRVAVLRGVALGDTVVASATFLVDAESNLAEAMGGMGGMPGMNMAPASPPPAPKPANGGRQ